MESQKRNLRARKPLSDCTNTVLSSQPSASNLSAAIKPRKRIIKSAAKHSVNNKKKGESNAVSVSASVNLQALAPNPSSDFAPAEPNPSFDSLPTEPSSSRPPTEEASTPSRPADLPSTSGTEPVSEPQSFYSRRNPTNKRKSFEIEVTPFIFATASKIQTRAEERDEYCSTSKARTVPYKKRQHTTKYGEDGKIELPREFVEQQKAYFSEVDAFELLVEEAKSSDSE